MSDSQYKEIVGKLEWRLREISEAQAELEVKRSELEKESANIRAVIAKLMPLCGQAPDPEDLSGLGFTDAIRRVLEFGHARMSANDVKEALASRGFDISGYSNPMASIYKILTRLKESEELEAETEGFNVFYKWKRKSYKLRRALLRSARFRAFVGESKPVPPANSAKTNLDELHSAED